MKEEALKLADELDKLHQYVPSEAPAMIRRLVKELDKQSPSMFTILSCGCKSEFMGFPSEWYGETRKCEPCVNYGSLCEQHFMEYEARPAQYLQQTKPLSDKEIWNWFEKNTALTKESALLIAKAIEERHGIK